MMNMGIPLAVGMISGIIGIILVARDVFGENSNCGEIALFMFSLFFMGSFYLTLGAMYGFQRAFFFILFS